MVVVHASQVKVCWPACLVTLTLGLLLAIPSPVSGHPGEVDADAVPAPLDDRYRPHIAAAEVVGIADPITALAMVQRGFQSGIWMGKPTRGPLIDKDRIAGVEDRKPLQGPDENRWEWDTYCNFVVHARDVPLDALAKVARRDLFFPNLMSAPSTNRGQPVHVQGRLGRLLKVDAPRRLWQDGVRYLYEGWIYPDEDNPYSVCEVVFTELPKGIELGEKVNYYVAGDAYFFKILRYEAPDKNDRNKKVRRDAPMFIGRTLALTTPPQRAEVDTPFTGILIPGVLIGISGLIGLFFVIHWFFRRGDRKVQRRIRDACASEFVEPPPDAPVKGNPSPAGETPAEHPQWPQNG